MLARYLNAPLLLLAWQVAPVRLSVGGGSGEFSFRDYAYSPAGTSCAGPYEETPAHTEADTYRSFGVSAEVRARNNLEFRAAIGNISDYSLERNGAFGAGQVSYERSSFGIGIGAASFGGPERKLEPSASLRVGGRGGVSLMADYHRPEPTMGLIGGPRVGIGLYQDNSRKVSLLAGIATTPVPDTARRAGAFLQLGFPFRTFGRSAGLSINGFVSGQREGNENKRIFSVGATGWVSP